jgi:RNA polymerase sigma-70 factor (ECF subfamily)
VSESTNPVEYREQDSSLALGHQGAHSQSRDDEELVRRAQEDDLWAAEQLVRRYQKKVYSLAYQMSFGDREEALDLTQESFLRVFRSIKRFRGDSSFHTWLYRIVVNACMDARRRRGRWSKVFFSRRTNENGQTNPDKDIEDSAMADDKSDPLSAVSSEQLKRDIKKALSALSKKQQIIFQLKVFQEMSIPEIAQTMGLAEGTVKSHLFRATQSVRNLLQGWAEN